MLNVIATGEQYAHSLTIETLVYAGINGVRVLKSKSVAMEEGTSTSSVGGILKDAPYEVNVPNMKMLSLSCSAPLSVTLTRNDNTVIVLSVRKVLTLDDGNFKKVVLVFTPSGEITQCQYSMSWMQQAT
jgi:hypothetical protein